MELFADQYAFHGLGLSVSSDHPAIAAAIHGRLAALTPADHTPIDMRVEVRCVADRHGHIVQRPHGKGQPVCSLPMAEVVYFADTDVFYVDYSERVRVWCEPTLGHTRISVADADNQAVYLASHPLFTLALVEMLKRRGRYHIHAAGLAIARKGLLVAGAGGSGKSTLTIALVRSGFRFMGDDTTFLAQTDDGLRMLAFPDEIDVTEETIALFPELRHLLGESEPSGRRKRHFRVEDVYSGVVLWEARPSALVFPRVSDVPESSLVPLKGDDALVHLMRNILLTEPRCVKAHLDVLAQLVRDCACYRLEAGRDFDRLPELLASAVR